MLPKEHRLQSDYDFRQVRRSGVSYKSPLFIINIARQNLAGPPRFGFIISNRVDRRAVERNRIKRILRAVINLHLKSFPEGVDIVFIVRPVIKNKSYEEISTELNKVLPTIPLFRSGVAEKGLSPS